MWGKKNRERSSDPSVRDAMDERDALMDQVTGAVQKVDRLQNELLQQYLEAERRDR